MPPCRHTDQEELTTEEYMRKYIKNVQEFMEKLTDLEHIQIKRQDEKYESRKQKEQRERSDDRYKRKRENTSNKECSSERRSRRHRYEHSNELPPKRTKRRRVIIIQVTSHEPSIVHMIL